MLRPSVLIALALAGVQFAPSASTAQAPSAAPVVAFEAASIRPSKSERRVFIPPRFEGTRLRGENVPVDYLITMAYGIKPIDLIGGPGWAREDAGERFDVLATAGQGSSREDQLAMLRRLLEERFGLRVHRETRDMPVHLLTAQRTGDEIGPNLHRASKDCAPRDACEGFVTVGKMSFKGARWSRIVEAIAGPLNGRLIDRTGLSVVFDVDLEFASTLSATPDDQRADIFTAVARQLGLKLQPGTAPIEVTVIDAVTRPTPN